MLSEREWATFIVAATLVVVCVSVPKLRKFLAPLVGDIVGAAFVRRIVGIYCGLLAWTAVVVLAGWLTGLWNLGLLKDTLIIVLTLGFPVLYRSVQAKSGPEILRRVITESAGITALLVFYINLRSFPFPSELAFQFALLLVIALRAAFSFMLKSLPAFEESSGKSCMLVLARVGQVVVSSLLILAALGTFVWTTVQLVVNAGAIQWLDLRWSFLLSLWLPALLVPYFYVVAFAAYCEVILQRLTFRSELSGRVQIAFILGLQLRVSLAARFNDRYKDLGRATTFREALRIMQAFRADLQRRDQDEPARLASLTTHAEEEWQ